MIGIVVILGVSWILLYFFGKKNLLVLGILPTQSRMKQWILGFLFTGTLCAIVQYFGAGMNNSTWSLNDELNSTLFFAALWWDVKSVITEELLFRGAVLFVLIKTIGSKKSLLVSAMAFGIYHWFSMSIIGNWVPMIVVFLGTGIMGYAWALAFVKTESILLPFGLHLGWNFVQNTIFSKGPLGDLVLVVNSPADHLIWSPLLNFLLPMIIAPIICLLFVVYFFRFEKIEFA